MTKEKIIETAQMENKSSKNDTVKKNTAKKIIKSIPTMPFEDVLQLAEAIWECASGQRVRKLTLFDHLGKSPESSLSRALVTASSKYGITTGGYQAEYLELTEIGAIASNPDSNVLDSINAKFQLAILSNKYFNHLYETFKSMKVPTNKVLEDSVIEFGIEQHEAKQCVETFIVNAKYIGLIQILSGAQRLIPIEHLTEKIQNEVNNTTESQLTISNTGTIDAKAKDICLDKPMAYEDICFYITPIGADDSEQRKHSDMLLECIISPVLEEFGLTAIRADQIDKPGIITNQILDYITKSKMVIADLSYHNPNVFYELAVRHMKGLPAIHIIRSCDKIPFDIGNFRTIILDMTDIYTFVPQLEIYKSQISSQLRSLLDANGDADNPISSYLNKLQGEKK